MKKIIYAIIILCLLVGNESIGAAEIHILNEINAIPAKVTDIYHCGNWENDKLKGFYRIVYIDFYLGNSLLYIQWVKDFTIDDPTRHILQTISIDEFNADDHIELTFDKPECMETENGISFKIETQSGHDMKTYLYDLQVSNEFGKYVIKERPEKDL